MVEPERTYIVHILLPEEPSVCVFVCVCVCVCVCERERERLSPAIRTLVGDFLPFKK